VSLRQLQITTALLGAVPVATGLISQSALFRAVGLMIFLGGAGRLASLLVVGLPLLPFGGFTVLEIVGAPLFVWWPRKLAIN